MKQLYQLSLDLIKKLDIKSIIIICLVVIVFFMRACSDSPEPANPTIKIDGKKYEVLKHTVDTVYRTSTTIKYKQGKTIHTVDSIVERVPVKVDTAYILRRYYNKYIYKDTLHLADNKGTIQITDTISKNAIQGRTYKADIKYPVIKETTIVKEPNKTQVYVGGVVGSNQQGRLSAGPGIILKTKSDRIFTVGGVYDGVTPPSIMGGVYWKIRLGK